MESRSIYCDRAGICVPAHIESVEEWRNRYFKEDKVRKAP